MKHLNVNGREIQIYNSAEVMPMKRYQRFNKFLMIDNEVGSDFEDFNRRSSKAIEFFKKKMIEEGIKELESRRQMVYNSFMEYSPKGRAFAILVHSIDGIVCNDYSKEGLDEVLKKLDSIGISQLEVVDTVGEVKKKSKKNWILTSLKNLIRGNR